MSYCKVNTSHQLHIIQDCQSSILILCKSRSKRIKQFIKNSAKYRLRTRTILQFPLPKILLQFQIQTDFQSNQSFEASLVLISLLKIHSIRYIKTNLARLTPRQTRCKEPKKKRTTKEGQSLIHTKVSTE